MANVTVSSPPTITNPSAISVCQGENGKTMSVSVTPSTGVTLQWYKGASGSGTALSNNSNYSGVTTPTLTFNSITSLLDITYYCVVTVPSTGCTATSSAARLTVNTPPTINSDPISTVACDGGTATMSVSAPGATQWTWYKVGSSSPLANGSDYSTTATQTLTINGKASTNGSYYCVVGNNGCTATSGTAELKVTIITSNPTSKDICPGTVTTMQVTATNATSYRWWKDGSAISTSDGNFEGVTSTRLSISGTAGTAGSYYCVVGNGVCSKESAHATLTVYPAINITTDLDPGFTPLFYLEVLSIGFQAEAEGGSGTLSQTWYLDDDPMIKDVEYVDVGSGYIYLSNSKGGSLQVGTHTIYCEFSDSHCTKKTSIQYFEMAHQDP
ncbi:MAG TPA: immunoglobulin domain-containing protein [Chitinispirillaceae bacterium]|nr:immunoglobulin domain-containing protein [Chitinispirillaceae bacterium]